MKLISNNFIRILTYKTPTRRIGYKVVNPRDNPRLVGVY